MLKMETLKKGDVLFNQKTGEKMRFKGNSTFLTLQRAREGSKSNFNDFKLVTSDVTEQHHKKIHKEMVKETALVMPKMNFGEQQKTVDNKDEPLALPKWN